MSDLPPRRRVSDLFEGSLQPEKGFGRQLLLASLALGVLAAMVVVVLAAAIGAHSDGLRATPTQPFSSAQRP